MKHVYAGIVVGAVISIAIVAALIMWSFLSAFMPRETAAILTGAIILVMAGSAVIDFITERREPKL